MVVMAGGGGVGLIGGVWCSGSGCWWGWWLMLSGGGGVGG